MVKKLKTAVTELRIHAPFTLSGKFIGIALMAVMLYYQVPRAVSELFFSTLHQRYRVSPDVPENRRRTDHRRDKRTTAGRVNLICHPLKGYN